MTVRRQRRSAAEWATIIDKWQSSGKSARQLAEDEGIQMSSLYLWRSS